MSSPIVNTATFDASLTLNTATQKAAAGIATDFSIEVVRFLAAQHGFDADEAIRLLGFDNLSVKPVTKKQNREKSPKVEKPKRDLPKVLLPWTGKAVEGWCHGIRLNHGLHTQCTQEDAGGLEAYPLCKTCKRQADKNASGKPTYGTIEDRLATGVFDFKDPKTGKLTVPYANVMEKLGIDKQTAIAEAERFGLTIPDDHFVARKSKRGRPAKVATSDSDDESVPKKPKGKRGRPAKAKKMIQSSTGDDLIAELMNQAENTAKSTDVSSDGSDTTNGKINANSENSDAENSEPGWSPAGSFENEVLEQEKPQIKAKKPKKPKMTDEEKAIKKQEKLEQKRAAKRVEKANKKKAADLEAKKASDLEAKKAADLEAKKAADLEAKNAVELEAEEYGTDTEGEDDGEEELVSKFEHDGKTYLKNETGVLFDPATQDPVGIWNTTTDMIDPYVEESDDEEENTK